jgi:hypothetical protein
VIAVLVLVCLGCREEGEPQGETKAPLPPVTPEATAADLGTEQAAGPFQITLSADGPEIRPRETRFRSQVGRGVQPVTDAGVVLTLQAPGTETAGPLVTLQHEGDGRYSGSAALRVPGRWTATVTVTDADQTGTAVYEFDVRP